MTPDPLSARVRGATCWKRIAAAARRELVERPCACNLGIFPHLETKTKRRERRPPPFPLPSPEKKNLRRSSALSAPLRFHRGAGALRQKNNNNNKRDHAGQEMRTRPGVVCDPRNLTNVRYSDASELLNTPLQTRSLESLSALATLSNCRRSGSPPPHTPPPPTPPPPPLQTYPSLPAFFVTATGRPLTWGGV